jgi:hypothetical protein
MMNRSLSIGTLLLTFGLVLLGLRPTQQSIYGVNIWTIPVVVNQVMGIIAFSGAIFFMIMAIRQGWSEKAEAWLRRPVVYYPSFVMFFGMYTVSYLKGIAAVFAASQPAWIEYISFYIGFAAFLYIGIYGLIKMPKKNRAGAPPA